MTNCGAGGGHFKHSLRTRMPMKILKYIKYIYELMKLRKKENSHTHAGNMERRI